MKRLLLFILLIPTFVAAQINTDRVMLMGRNALYYEDYVLSIQRFNMVINAKPWLSEPYFYRALAKFYLEDYQGAEIDCGNAIERNPYSMLPYSLRALTRINQEFYEKAIADYHEALRIKPLERDCWHNLTLCHLELKQYNEADSCLDMMLQHWPKEANLHTLKAQVAFNQKDTIKAEKWIDEAIRINEFDGQAWSMKAIVLSARKNYKEAEGALDKAITQSPRQANLYVNRALMRYNQDNLRGAMSDYDAALDMDDTNFLAHYNRGLLRASVGENNLAIEDFNFVLKLEPDNTIALYNRALLLDNVGDHQGAIRDLSAVINDYPDFWEGYRLRAAIRRKIGDVYGAERDEFKLLKAQLAVKTGTYKPSSKTRKRGDVDFSAYDKLVEDEEQQETTQEYANMYRGKVQNRPSRVEIPGLYVLSYHTMVEAMQAYVPYAPFVESINQRHILPHTLYITLHEGTLSQQLMDGCFNRIRQVESTLEEREPEAADSLLLLRQAVDYNHVRDFENAIFYLDELKQMAPQIPLVHILLAQSRYASISAQKSSMDAAEMRLGLIMVLQDYTTATTLLPTSPYLHYNKGCVQVELGEYSLGIESFTKALELDNRFPAAYFSRGIAYLLSGQKDKAMSDLSQAGELGMYSAYSLIKRYSKEEKKSPSSNSTPAEKGNNKSKKQ